MRNMSERLTNSTNGHEPDAAATGASGSRRLTHRQLSEQFDAQTADEGALVEEPLDSGLWPTAGLSDDEVKWLSEALDDVPRSALRKKSTKEAV